MLRCAAKGGSKGHRSVYECDLFTADPGGNGDEIVDGKEETVALHWVISVAHQGCTYAVGTSNPVFVSKACGVDGLRRIAKAIPSSD